MAHAAVGFIIVTLLAIVLGQTQRFHYPTYLKYVFLQTAVLMLWVAWAAERALSPPRGEPKATLRERLHGRIPELLLAAYLLWASLSVAWSGLPYVSMLGLLPLVFRIAWVFLIAAFVRTRRHVEALLWGIVAAGFLGATATGVAMLLGRKLTCFFGHRNFGTMFLLSPIVIATAAWMNALARRGDIKRIWFLILGPVALIPMVTIFALGGSLGGLLGLAAAFFLLVLIRVPRRRRTGLLAALLVLLLVGGAAVVVFRTELFDRFVAGRRHTAIATRYFYLIGSWRMFAGRPLSGWGAGTFLNRYPMFRPAEAGQYGVMGHLSLHPHNELAFIALQFGIIGLGLFLALLWRVPARALRGFPEGELRWPLLALIAGLSGMVVHSIFNVSLRFWGAADMFWLHVGLLLAIGRGACRLDPGRGSPPPASNRVSLGSLALLCVTVPLAALIWWQTCVQGIRSELALGNADTAEARNDWASAVTCYRRGIYFSRYNTDYVLSHARLGHALVRARRVPAAIQTFTTLHDMAPGLGKTPLALGDIYYGRFKRDLRDNPDRARRHLHLAAAYMREYVALRPYQRKARQRLAIILRYLGGDALSEAIGHLEWLRERRPHDPAPRFLLGRCRMDLKDYAAAEPDFAAAAALNVERLERDLTYAAVSLVLSRPLWTAAALAGTAQRGRLAAEAQRWAARAAGLGGNFERACGHLREALRVFPEDTEAAAMLHRLTPAGGPSGASPGGSGKRPNTPAD